MRPSCDPNSEKYKNDPDRYWRWGRWLTMGQIEKELDRMANRQRYRTNGEPMGAGTVPNKPFRERYKELQARGYTTAELAGWIGWYERGRPDVNRLRRAVGVSKYSLGHGKPMVYKKMVTEETALELCRGLRLYPRDVGL